MPPVSDWWFLTFNKKGALMNKISRFFILVCVFLALLNIAYAASFDVKVTPINDKIVVDEVAEFNITVINNLDTAEQFTIKKAGYPF